MTRNAGVDCPVAFVRHDINRGLFGGHDFPCCWSVLLRPLDCHVAVAPRNDERSAIALCNDERSAIALCNGRAFVTASRRRGSPVALENNFKSIAHTNPPIYVHILV